LNMKNLVENFVEQLEQAIEIGESAKLSASKNPIQNVLISGLGGSGIGGTIVSELVVKQAKVPINVSKGYFVPAYVNENSLVIISSYSGNTEETVNALEIALGKGAKVVCITSGGKVEEISKLNNLDLILIPGGHPPRACLGYSITQLFYVLSFNGIISNFFKKELKASIDLLRKEQKNIRAEALKISEVLLNKMAVIYSTTYNEGVVIRFRQQLNENAKMLCWHHVFPELNHNELVGWTQRNEDLAVIIFRNHDDFARNQTRIEISKEVFVKYTPYIIEIFSKGATAIEQAIYFIHIGDWISCYLADIKGVDAHEIKIINHLKSELAKI